MSSASDASTWIGWRKVHILEESPFCFLLQGRSWPLPSPSLTLPREDEWCVDEVWKNCLERSTVYLLLSFTFWCSLPAGSINSLLLSVTNLQNQACDCPELHCYWLRTFVQFKGEVEEAWCGHKYKTSHTFQSEIYYNKAYILISIPLISVPFSQ